MITDHRFFFSDSAAMGEVRGGSVSLVVTSPPYPMIGMWDEMFCARSPGIGRLMEEGRHDQAFEAMHQVLDGAWREVDRVLAPAGIVCINVGDATRTLGERFRLYPNHVRIARFFLDGGYDMLPLILWRKQSNKPNKFMGSGMLPVNAYVTLEHEYILVFRKGGNRTFSPEEKAARRRSAFFREERNAWFSDVWTDLKGVPQGMTGPRGRSAAFPLELPYRLIQMYSIQGDTVLDPFLGTGTMTLAAMAAGRSSIGYEIDEGMREAAAERVAGVKELAARLNDARLERHRALLRDGGSSLYPAGSYGFGVATRQETDIRLPVIRNVRRAGPDHYEVTYVE